MVRELELRAWVCVWPRAAASAWPRFEQVHLVRLDVQWIRLPLQPDAATREVTAMNAFACAEVYALLIMTRIKRVENRIIVPLPISGRLNVREIM